MDLVSSVYEDVIAHREGWWDIKLRGIVGDSTGDAKEGTILNHILTWDGAGLTLKADLKNRASRILDLILGEGSKRTTAPSDRDSFSVEGHVTFLGPEGDAVRSRAA